MSRIMQIEDLPTPPRDGHDADHPVVLTEQLAVEHGSTVQVRRFRLVHVEGGQVGTEWESVERSCTIGTNKSNDLVLDDPWVSRFHCEIAVERRGVRLRDLGSRNGTMVDGMRVFDAWLRPGSVIRLGRTALRFVLASDVNRLPLSERKSFGPLVGESAAMRATFTLLERAAASDATVLIEGESGTGKEGAAQAIHEHGARRNKPFIVVDCASIPANLLESELFGHERGSFTGAETRRAGAFEEADGGTVFLDEIGELSADLQPKLLRVLEQREIRRLGSNVQQPVNVRVIAATNRDLRAEVNAGRFRSDLYYRLAVVRVPMPALRHRPEDIPALARHLVEQLGRGAQADELLTPPFLAQLQGSAWPGNVRELRNHLERCLVIDGGAPDVSDAGAPTAPAAVDDDEADLTYAAARKRALAEFERRYLEKLLRKHDHSVSRAAEAARMNRVYLYRLLHRHGLMR
jgi:DNA-binding NtrC family response regulator